MRDFGVEEEFLVVDPHSGRALPIGPRLVDLSHRVEADARFAFTTEIQQEQVELVTQVCSSADMLEASLRTGRRHGDDLAQRCGARLAALGTSPLEVAPHLTATPRYQEIARRAGVTAAQQLTCGYHVHVGVASDEEGVGVLDRIRPWLPVLHALSVNSPFWNGQHTGYSSFRRQIWTRLPLTGPGEIYGSAAAYHARVRQWLATEVILDEGMVYFDARLCRNHPTVEIRVADVCPTVDVAVLVAALCRALVETAARAWALAEPPAQVPVALLELAMWQASKSGLSGPLLGPTDGVPQAALDVVDALLRHVAPALRDAGDKARVDDALARLRRDGTGAQRQQAEHRANGDLRTVVYDAIARTQSELPQRVRLKSGPSKLRKLDAPLFPAVPL